MDEEEEGKKRLRKGNSILVRVQMAGKVLPRVGHIGGDRRNPAWQDQIETGRGLKCHERNKQRTDHAMSGRPQ